MDDFKKYSSEKADDVFNTLPYTIATEQEYNRFLVKRDRVRRRLVVGRVVSVFTRVAAILFIPLLLYTLYCHRFGIPQFSEMSGKTAIAEAIHPQQQALIEYTTYSGMRGKVILPDSTEVWLNSCSALKAPARFDSTGRHVELSGEAYFKVKSNKNWPMFIKTNDIVTKVIGTEFNLSAYSNDPAVTLTLVDGKVELIKKDESKITMKPNEQAVLFNNPSKKDIIRKDVQNFENALIWKEGYLVFNNTPMEDVIQKLERWYGVKFGPINSRILKYNFTGRFKEESVTRVLDLLSISSNIRYKINNSTVTLYQN